MNLWPVATTTPAGLPVWGPRSASGSDYGHAKLAYLLCEQSISRVTRSLRDGILDQTNRRIWVRNFNDEFGEVFVVQLNDNRLLRMAHIPENVIAFLIKRPGSKDVGNGRAD